MSPRTVLALLAVVVAGSLVAAPMTMNDWSEQAAHYAEPVDADAVDGETTVIRDDSLSPRARDAVRGAIEDGHHVVYGFEEWPDRFRYSDVGQQYTIVRDGQHYRLTTLGIGGFPFVYWVMELPFVAFGALLGLGASRLHEGDAPPAAVGAAAVAGVAVHLLGPEFDFPVVGPGGFLRLGVVLAVALAAWLARARVRTLRGRLKGVLG